MAEKSHAELMLQEMPPGLAALMTRADGTGNPRPVEKWNPPDCGPIDIRIDAEGAWYHLGSPIGRLPLVKLFASVLRKEPDGTHVLVTPAEKLSITVDDVAFIAVEMHAQDSAWQQKLMFRTNVGDVVTAGPEHPLRFAVETEHGGLKPYLLVRGGLEARLSRPLLYQLVDLAIQDGKRFGVVSDGVFFEMTGAGGGA